LAALAKAEKPPWMRHTPNGASALDAEREARRLEANALHKRFLDGEISEAMYERLRQDIGKEPDDLTRYSEGARA